MRLENLQKEKEFGWARMFFGRSLGVDHQSLLVERNMEIVYRPVDFGLFLRAGAN